MADLLNILLFCILLSELFIGSIYEVRNAVIDCSLRDGSSGSEKVLKALNNSITPVSVPTPYGQ